MGRRSSDEFPLLPACGLYAAPIEGNGNCLFNALSDQIYGDQSRHGEIRSRVIEYMRENEDYFKQFIEVNPGGGVRRNPKRKNAGAFSTPISTVAPTAEEIDASFEKHINRMAQGGTYGDNLEIQAFSTAYGVDVKIYQRDLALVVSGSYEEKSNGRVKPVAHIAYHQDYEHFSSVRNVNGPHSGLPKVQETYDSAEAKSSAKKAEAKTSVVAPWMVDVVKKSLPFPTYDLGAIHRALVKSNGDVDVATSELLENEERGSVSSTQGSSSVERDQDCDDESVCGPKKKRDRRLSRAARANAQQNHELTYRPKEVKSEATSSAQDTKVEKLRDSKDNSAKEESKKKDSQIPEPSAVPGSVSHQKSTQPRRKKEEYDSDWSESLHDRSNSRTRGQTTKKRGGSKGRLISARDLKDMKKAAQKAAAKERKQGLVDVDRPISKGTTVSVPSKGLHRNAPTVGIKTLYV